MKPVAGRRQESSDREVLAGLVERVTFHNPENGFCVLRTRARGHRDLVTVVGHAAMVAPGEWITASGEWVNDRTHGQQFKARFVRTAEPSSVEGIEKYLGSGMIRGIGPVYARKLVRAFGEKVFDVIEAEPERLREVTGIGKVRAKRITDAWAEQKVVREIMVFLHSHGVGTARAVRIFRTYGADAVEVMTENPYRLARDIRGIGFVTADAIAMKLGIAKTAMVRGRAGIGYALTEAMDEGHCGLPEEELGPLAAKLLEVPSELIRTALDLELAEGTVVADTVENTPCIFLGGLHRAERAIAGRLLGIAAGNLPWPDIDPGKALPWVEGKTELALAPGQADAVRAALSSKVSVITGGPGVGKTTIVDAILRVLSAKGVDILLCAPTGRAAKRMSEATGFEAKTIHRLLEVDPRTGGFRRDADNPLDCGLLVVDETSMVDVMLMRALLAAVSDGAALLIVGDVDQLPSVGPGQVLADIIPSGAVPVVRLTEVFRQAAQSRIVTTAHGINRGAIPDLSRPEGDSDFYFVPAEDPETAAARIVELVKTRIPQRFGFDAMQDIQVLCPMNRGGAGARSLNIELQAALNPAGERKVERFGWTFAPGDKVMQIENDYDKEAAALLADLDALRDLPASPFEACEHVPGQVSSVALVRYRLADYSAPAVHAHKKVTIKGYVDRVEIALGAEIVAAIGAAMSAATSSTTRCTICRCWRRSRAPWTRRRRCGDGSSIRPSTRCAASSRPASAPAASANTSRCCACTKTSRNGRWQPRCATRWHAA